MSRPERLHRMKFHASLRLKLEALPRRALIAAVIAAMAAPSVYASAVLAEPAVASGRITTTALAAAPLMQPAASGASLVVTVTGVPAGIVATINITGPKQRPNAATNYVRTIHATTTIKGLATGAYTIKALPFTANSASYTPNKTSGKVTLKKSGKATYTVTYTKGATTSDGTPEAVTNLIVEPGAGKLNVRWTGVIGAPAAGLTYAVTAAPGGASCSPGKSPCIISGLSPETAYVVTVTVTNSAGKSASTVAPQAVTPLRAGQSVVDGVIVGPGLDLSSRSLIGARLVGVSLKGTNLSNANLTSANLTTADLSYANLTGADLRATTLKGVKSGFVTGTPTNLPSGWKLISGYLVGPGANLTDADLSDQDLSGARLSGANLRGANFTSADFRDVSGKDLRGLVFDNTKLAFANLAGVNLSGSSFKNVDLTGASLEAANAGSASFVGATLTNANLTGTALTNADLSLAKLNQATVTDAVFTGSITKSLAACGVLGTPSTLPAQWQLVGRCLIGPKAGLSGADFSYLDLSGVSLAGATLSSAIFRGANLTDVDLTGATVTLADFAEATFTGPAANATRLSGTPKSAPKGWRFDATAKSFIQLVP